MLSEEEQLIKNAQNRADVLQTFLEVSQSTRRDINKATSKSIETIHVKRMLDTPEDTQ
jgi:hypothetical protein